MFLNSRVHPLEDSCICSPVINQTAYTDACTAYEVYCKYNCFPKDEPMRLETFRKLCISLVFLIFLCQMNGKFLGLCYITFNQTQKNIHVQTYVYMNFSPSLV